MSNDQPRGMRVRITLLALGCASLLGVPTARAQITASPIPGDPVMIASGQLSGKLLASGVRAYLGVPFAAAPIRELRWREPQPVQGWKGVYHADRFAPQCTQILRPMNINHYFGHEATSEDCLYLNIWAPRTDAIANKVADQAAVIVWIHGGGLSIGSASMANYDGENLARKGVVYVSIAYRLGGFGFMAHPELTAESPRHASGNYGFLDQVAALQWIQSNIAQFGGDPTRVVIAGQSAGASSAFLLQASPLARGLFHGIVGMSGGGLRAGSDPVPLAAAEASGLEMQKAMRVQSLAELRSIPADRLLAAQAEFQLGGTAGTVGFRPTVDGYFLPRLPREIFAAGAQSDVPIVVGFTRDESSNELRTATTVDSLRAIATRYFGERAPEFLRLYPARTAAQVLQIGAQAARDGGMATSIRSWALAQTTNGRAPAYIYMYARAHPYAPGVQFADHDPASAGAYHTSEVPYFLLTQDAYNRFRQTRIWTDFDRTLASRMAEVLVEFARTGQPQGAELRLPRFEPKLQRYMEIGDTLRVLQFDPARMDFLAAFNPPVAVGRTPTPRPPRD
jgi:para-nitrobenzyl esterase